MWAQIGGQVLQERSGKVRAGSGPQLGCCQHNIESRDSTKRD